MLKRVQRVVVNEDADRTMGRKQMRDVLQHASQVCASVPWRRRTSDDEVSHLRESVVQKKGGRCRLFLESRVTIKDGKHMPPDAVNAGFARDASKTGTMYRTRLRIHPNHS